MVHGMGDKRCKHNWEISVATPVESSPWTKTISWNFWNFLEMNGKENGANWEISAATPVES